MKRIFSYLLLALIAGFAFSTITHAQVWSCNGVGGSYAIAGTPLTVKCPDVSPPSPTKCYPPEVLDPNTNTCKAPGLNVPCDASQTSTPINGKTFARQCSGRMVIYPSGIEYNGALDDLSSLLGHKAFPSYIYSGQTPTFYIDSGYYVSLEFTPNADGLIKFTANTSYGTGGAISLSTFPGGITQGTYGVICAQTSGGLNSIIASTTSGSCRVSLGLKYYINFVSTDANGDQLCFGQPIGATCSQSRVAYAFTARAQ